MATTHRNRLLRILTAAIAIAATAVVVSSCSDQPEDTEMATQGSSLKAKLEERKSSFNAKAPDDVKRTYADGIRAVVESGVVQQAKQLGDRAPDFELTNAAGQPVRLSDYLQRGPVVLTWYRGGWCPYCNLTLNALQAALPDIKAQGANLLALTPELPDQSMSTAEKHALDFEVLSDIGSDVAREYGIVYKLTDDVAATYEENFGLSATNGDDSNELPLAATYIISPEGEITYAFLDADYRNRAEPSDIVAALKK